jgi:hypothetical protein
VNGEVVLDRSTFFRTIDLPRKREATAYWRRSSLLWAQRDVEVGCQPEDGRGKLLHCMHFSQPSVVIYCGWKRTNTNANSKQRCKDDTDEGV